MAIPESLVEAIRSGNCVAFVGAGFAGAARLPSWGSLLSRLAERDEDASRRAHVEGLIARGTAHSFDEAAQLLEDALGRAAFTAELLQALSRPQIPPAMQERLRWLLGIPFRAILTTNFDPLLTGSLPQPKAYREVLRPEATHPWWKELLSDGNNRGVPLVKVHGDVHAAESVVITRRDYRRLLYSNPGYQAFVRTVFASHPILYLGFSFTDAYLNELRSEILALIGYSDGKGPPAHAIINDVSPYTVEHYRSHEGIQILTYDTDGGRDHSGFDRLLAELYERTNPISHFGRLLQGRRLLWVDAERENNEHIRRFFILSKELSGVQRDAFHLELADDAESALARLAEAPFDLVISHWGRQPDGGSTAERLLLGMRRRDLRAPVVVFSLNVQADERKRKALGLGAQGYCFTNEALLRAIERIFAPAAETG
jgi:CheY-like chemotaxis protein